MCGARYTVINVMDDPNLVLETTARLFVLKLEHAYTPISPG